MKTSSVPAGHAFVPPPRQPWHLCANTPVKGIPEYVLCDVLGGLLDPDAPHSPPGMVLYRLEEGAYRESRTSGTDPSVFRSDVLGASVRLLPPREPVRAREDFRFQWWDGEQGRWRDHRTDAEHERMEMAVGLLHAYLGATLDSEHLDRIEVHWREHGPPDTVMDRILHVQKVSREWRSLLGDHPRVGTADDNREF